MSEQKDKGHGGTDISAPRLIETYKKKLAQRIINGDINLADELAKLAAYEERARRKKATPALLKPKRRYTFSVDAHEARIRNSRKSTGPVSTEGKAASSQNAKHTGIYQSSLLMQLRKPCKSTCEKFHECEVVGNGTTRPGGACLDKVHFLEVLDAITTAYKTKDTEALYDLVAVELAGVFDVKRELQEAINTHGGLIWTEVIDELGGVVQKEVKLNPAVKAYIELISSFGLTLRDQNMTPSSISKNKIGEEMENVASFIAGVMQKAPARRK